jgi:pimeloyl-ACP methyl ester carboxylesterase
MKKLMLLHGLMGSKEQFEKLEPLLQQDFEVHAFNFSGHGLAEFYFPEFSVEAFADQVISFLDSRQIEKTDFFGYGLGGYVGLYLARYFSDRVNKVMTFATQLEWNPDKVAKEIQLLNAEVLEQRYPEFAAQLSERHGEKKWKLLVEKSARLLTALGDEPLLNDEDFRGMIHQIRICVGDSDKMVSVQEQMNVLQLLKNGSLSVFPKTRHAWESMDSDRLIFEMKSFFASDKS